MCFRNSDRRMRVVVHGDEFLAAGPTSLLRWLQHIIDKKFEGKHQFMGSSSTVSKSIIY